MKAKIYVSKDECVICLLDNQNKVFDTYKLEDLDFIWTARPAEELSNTLQGIDPPVDLKMRPIERKEKCSCFHHESAD